MSDAKKDRVDETAAYVRGAQEERAYWVSRIRDGQLDAFQLRNNLNGDGTVRRSPAMNPVRCDFGDKCPSHASPEDRPCEYDPSEAVRNVVEHVNTNRPDLAIVVRRVLREAHARGATEEREACVELMASWDAWPEKGDAIRLIRSRGPAPESDPKLANPGGMGCEDGDRLQVESVARRLPDDDNRIRLSQYERSLLVLLARKELDAQQPVSEKPDPVREAALAVRAAFKDGWMMTEAGLQALFTLDEALGKS